MSEHHHIIVNNTGDNAYVLTEAVSGVVSSRFLIKPTAKVLSQQQKQQLPVPTTINCPKEVF